MAFLTVSHQCIFTPSSSPNSAVKNGTNVAHQTFFLNYYFTKCRFLWEDQFPQEIKTQLINKLIDMLGLPLTPPDIYFVWGAFNHQLNPGKPLFFFFPFFFLDMVALWIALLPHSTKGPGSNPGPGAFLCVFRVCMTAISGSSHLAKNMHL